MIPQSFIQDLLSRLDIVSVVERYLPLKRAGANYAACCPFHSEKTPSFTVSPSKQFYHCFGCGAHGSAIGFVMEYQGLGFVEAVRELAQSIGMRVPDVRDDGAAARSRPSPALGEVMERAARYYREALKHSEKAIAYLRQRGLTGEIAARFGMGYAPDGWQNLAAVFDDYAMSPALAEAGLVIDHESGKRYDRFRDRVMFPILDQKGGVIGFGGRVIGEGEPKYLNSPETPLFEKGRELYGLVQARQAIRAAGRVLVVEGYMDVVALAQHEVGYAVATLGTATTPVHVQKLLRQADDVVFCFDGDAAGRKAAWRALENSLELTADGKRLSFLFLPPQDDPDSYIRRCGKAAFEKLLGEALPLSEFLLRELSTRNDMATPEGRAAFAQAVRPLLARVAAPTLAMLLGKRAAELVGLSAAELGLASARHGPRTARGAVRAPPPSAARRLLELLLERPALARELDVSLPPAEDMELRAAAEILAFLRQQAQVSTAAQLLHHFQDAPFAGLVQAAAGCDRWSGFSAEELTREFADTADKIRLAWASKAGEKTVASLQRKDWREWTPEERQQFLRGLRPGGTVAG